MLDLSVRSKYLKISCRSPTELGLWNCLCGDVTSAGPPIHPLSTFFSGPCILRKHLTALISNLPTDLGFLAAYFIVPWAVFNRNTRKQHLTVAIFSWSLQKVDFTLIKTTPLTRLEKSLTVLDSYHLRMCVFTQSWVRGGTHKEQRSYIRSW